MPGLDGTGPMGQGPFTGGGRGYCAGYPVVRRGGGFGFGRGYGRGRGFGWGGAVSPYGAANVTPQAEAQFLRDQAGAMQEEIKAINARLKELESSPESQNND